MLWSQMMLNDRKFAGARRFLIATVVGAGLFISQPSDIFAQQQAKDFSAPLYTLVRSLQYVQDSVVAGDFSAMDMQRFLLEQVDRKLREAQPEDFDDPRNVDAALIYAMSGGNPKTLDLIVARDRYGYFDEEITGIMRAYLNGLVPTTKKPMKEIVEEYLDTSLGPYIALIAANVKAAAKDIKSVELFNLARLSSPGSLIEEAALRRSILISINSDMVGQALKFAHIYARRFSKSPYNVQFSQLIIEMIVQNLEAIDEVIVDEIISYLPRDQQKRIYLRIARTGVVDGNSVMAKKALQKLHLFEDENAAYYELLSNFYANIRDLSLGETRLAYDKIKAIKRRSLSPIDKPLYDAAVALAEQILELPTEQSLAQARKYKLEKNLAVAELRSVNLKKLSEAPDVVNDDPLALPNDVEFANYMKGRMNTVDEVDALLEAAAEEDKS
jgi:chemotaxis protein MotC